MLGLATVDDTDIKLTDDGRSFAAGDIDTAKSIFARQAKARAPLVRAICNSLAATSDGTLSEDFFLDMLRRGFTEDRAHQQLDLAIDWGRYAELYEFDADTGQLKLDHPLSADAKGQTPASSPAHWHRLSRSPAGRLPVPAAPDTAFLRTGVHPLRLVIAASGHGDERHAGMVVR